MSKITVMYEEKPCYEIHLKQNFDSLCDVLNSLGIHNRRVCIVTDSTVESLYLEEVVSKVQSCAKEVVTFSFPAGEHSKTLEVIYQLYETLISSRFDRQDLLIALGGGVVGDMTGYAAATYLRGIRFVQIPTTLLSMVDSSVGGKTGVDYKSYKNMVGAFHQPSAVYMNVSVLSTLTKEQYQSGMGEIIKHALIMDQEYDEWLSSHQSRILDLDPATLIAMIEKSILIKKEVVERDPKEKRDRAMLNFGHTIGHAIEKQMEFSMLHGNCVAVGVIAACHISYQRGYLTKQELEQCKNRIASFGLPTTIPAMDTSTLLDTIQLDKKMEAGQIKFILLDRIGHAFIDQTVTKDEMNQAMKFIMQ